MLMEIFELIRKINEGDRNAMCMLVEQNKKLVMHIAGRIVRHQFNLDDVCQEVFIKIFRNLNTYRGEARFSVWVAGIAYNTALNWMKKSKRNQPEDIDNISETEMTTDKPDDPQTLMQKAELSAYINRLIEMLPLKYRTVITLFYLDQFSYNEIEQITGLAEGTVKIHLFRGRQILKEKLIKLKYV